MNERAESTGPSRPAEQRIDQRSDRPERGTKGERADRTDRTDRESKYKLERLAEFLGRRELDGVLLLNRANFAWITNGRENHAADANPMCRAAILATADSRVCLADSTEAPRMKEEVLAGTGIPVVAFPWYDHRGSAIKVLAVNAGRRTAADADPF